MQKQLFDITGMTCSACSARVEKTVAGLAGVQEVSVNLLKNSMSVSYDDSLLSTAEISSAVENAGYGAVARPQKKPRTGRREGSGGASHLDSVTPAVLELKEMKRRLLVSLLFTIPLFYISMGHMAGLPLAGFFLGPENALTFAFTQFLLTLPVMIVNGRYYRVGFKTLFQGSPNMDSLIAIGSGAAAVFGVYAIFKISTALGHNDLATVQHFAMNLYFESAAMILTLITLGKFFEARAKGKTTDAIARLIDLAPKTATVLRGGKEAVIACEEVQPGDILVVKSGESVPVDGVITQGYGYLDESALSGESVPVEKQPGDTVTGASISRSGHFLMQATRVGENTTLAQIIRLVDEATSSKAPIARLADKISSFFVPVVIVIAFAATVIWLLLGHDLEFALGIGISVLVISCPCALGLATPTAIMVGTGRGAANGILLKSAEAIQTAQSINTVVLDKTGTVTEGKPEITDIIPATGVDETELLQIAASLEKLSEHPLGAPIIQEAENRGLGLKNVSDFTQTPGQGIAGNIEGVHYLAGNQKMLEARGIMVGDNLQLKTDTLTENAKTALYFARENELLGIIAVADLIKPSSPQAVAELEALGINVVMLTGDNAKTAAAVKREAGIKQVLAEVLPQDKEREIRKLQEQGKKVAMVGDGINDAPALARADVGIAIGAGTDVAIESADIVLMKSNLLDAVTAIELSKAVMRNIRQNLFWAFFYNSVGIPVAAGVFYGIWGLTLNPVIAAAAMSLSSVSVVSNALRLRFFKPRRSRSTQSASSAGYTDIQPENRRMIMNKIIRIDGMSCGHCSATVEKALRAIPGVTDVKVDLAEKQATLVTDSSVSDDMLQTAVANAGFEPKGIKNI